jgi:shikimate dehydrogenase
MASANPHSVLLGLLGGHIGASRSPLLHEAEARHHGLQLVYRLVDFIQLGITTPDLPMLLSWARRFGFDGFNVTHPYKAVIIPLLQSLSPEARALAAANTVLFREGAWHGHNTDWVGFAQSLRRDLPAAALDRVAQIGAGGAGTATAYALLTLGAQCVRIFDINAARSAELAARLSPLFPHRDIGAANSARAALAQASGVVLATPVGMAAHPGVPFDPALLRSEAWVADVIYAPLETELLAAARRLGCRTMNGGGMLTYQAAEAFRLFTGIAADADRMRECFHRAVASTMS